MMPLGATITMLLFLTFGLVQICLAGGHSIQDIAAVTFRGNDGIQLDLGHGKIYDSTTYKKAIIFLEELKTTSSCHRLAASTLVQTCQILDQKTDLDVALSDVKEEYAAKVAACELSAVLDKSRDVVPKACKAFLPSKNACAKSEASGEKLCYAHTSRPQVVACISALQDRPQSWTSYSNALQNVHHTCQASRFAIDKDLMLDQLKSALDTVASSTEQSREAFQHYQTQASTNLARFQEVHTDVISTIKNDWAQMSEDLTQHTWKSYLNVFGDIAKHYGNLTDYFSRSSAEAIVKSNEALEKVHAVNDALNDGKAAVTDLVSQQATLQATASDNNAALLQAQAHLQARSEFALSVMETMAVVLANQATDLDKAVNSTNSLLDFTKGIGPLLALLAPLTNAARIVTATTRAVMRVDSLTWLCVVTNGITFVFVGKKVVASTVWSLGGALKVLVVLHLALYLIHATSPSQTSLGGFIITLVCSRISGVLLLASHYSGALNYPFTQTITHFFTTRTNTTTAVIDPASGMLTPPATPPPSSRRQVTFADPVAASSVSQRRRPQDFSRAARRTRAASEDVRAAPAWE